MSGPASPNGQDPNMEDILASIRRILNEDEPAATPPAKPAAVAMGAPATAAREDEEPLELTEAMMVAGMPTAAPPVAATPPLAAPAPVPAAEPARSPVAGSSVPAAPEVTAEAVPLRDALLAPATAAATAAALGELARAVSAERTAPVTRSGPSIEDVVREEVRPVVKAWLDNHLPGMVERMVRAEIERLVGGPR